MPTWTSAHTILPPTWTSAHKVSLPTRTLAHTVSISTHLFWSRCHRLVCEFLHSLVLRPAVAAETWLPVPEAPLSATHTHHQHLSALRASHMQREWVHLICVIITMYSTSTSSCTQYAHYQIHNMCTITIYTKCLPSCTQSEHHQHAYHAVKWGYHPPESRIWPTSQLSLQMVDTCHYFKKTNPFKNCFTNNLNTQHHHMKYGRWNPCLIVP